MNSRGTNSRNQKFKIGHCDHFDITKDPHSYFSRRAPNARHTAHMHSCTAQQNREAVMTDDGSQPPTEQLATAVYRGSATPLWRGPLLLVLLGGVVMCCVIRLSLGRRLVNLLPVAQRTNALTNGVVDRPWVVRREF